MCLPPFQCNHDRCKIPETYGCSSDSECFSHHKCDDYPFRQGQYHALTGYRKACRERNHIIGNGSTSALDAAVHFMEDRRRCDRQLFDSLVRYWEFPSSHSQHNMNRDIKNFNPCPGKY